MEHTLIPREELEVFRALPNISVVFDVGARADTDYWELKSGAIVHAFEPNPAFFMQLEDRVEEMGFADRAILNCCGLGDEQGEFFYNDAVQGFDGGEAWTGETPKKYPIQTLDWYVKENRIRQIDFLKIDVEGYDYKVLLGGKRMLPKCRFVQYEHWDNTEQYYKLLEKDFEMEYIGYRNVLCMNRKLTTRFERQELKALIYKNDYYKL